MLESKASLCHICMDLPVNMFCFVLFCFLIIIRHMLVQSNSFKKLTFIYLFILLVFLTQYIQSNSTSFYVGC